MATYTQVEVEAAIKIVQQFGGEVSAACVAEVKYKLNRPVTAKTVRSWWRASITPKPKPKRQHRRVNPLPEMGTEDPNYLAEASPTFREIQGNKENQNFPSNFPLGDNYSFVDKHRSITRSLLERAEREVETLSTQQLFKELSRAIADQKVLMDLEGVEIEVLTLVGSIVKACLANEVDPKKVFEQIPLLIETCHQIDFAPNEVLEDFIEAIHEDFYEKFASPLSGATIIDIEPMPEPDSAANLPYMVSHPTPTENLATGVKPNHVEQSASTMSTLQQELTNTYHDEQTYLTERQRRDDKNWLR